MLRNLIVAIVFATFLIHSQQTTFADPPPEGRVTLMGMLSEWLYPDAKFGGATMSDAAVSDIVSINAKAVLTTPDSAEKVIAFYRTKLKVDVEGKNLGGEPGERITSDRSVSIQDNSRGDVIQLFVINVHDKNASATLVISRATGESETHIAWSNFRRLMVP